MSELFPKILLEKLSRRYGHKLPLVPDPYEVVYTASQLFETGIRVTHHFVVRDGKTIIFKEEKERMHQ